MLVNLHIAFGNIISLSASILIVSAHSLIAFWKAIRLSPRIFIASTLPSDTTCSLTVPGGDTPCVTAGDARRANPWRSDALTSDAGGVAQQPRFCTSELPPPRFQCDAAGVGVSFVHFPHGFPLALARVSPAVTHGAPPPEALLCVDVDAGVILCCCGRTKGRSGYSLLISSNSYSFIKEKRLYICLQS